MRSIFGFALQAGGHFAPRPGTPHASLYTQRDFIRPRMYTTGNSIYRKSWLDRAKLLTDRLFASPHFWVIEMQCPVRPNWEHEEKQMNEVTLKFYVKLNAVYQALRDECGQDLIEYVLIGGVVALGAVAGMSKFANSVNSAFSNLGSKLNSYTS
jgi:pilus assembly protein Flp/PilA